MASKLQTPSDPPPSISSFEWRSRTRGWGVDNFGKHVLIWGGGTGWFMERYAVGDLFLRQARNNGWVCIVAGGERGNYLKCAAV